MDIRKQMRPFESAIEIPSLAEHAEEVLAMGRRMINECNAAHRTARAKEREKRKAIKIAPGRERRKKNANGFR